MPRTRSQVQVQPELPFPRRKSCRASKKTTASPQKCPPASPTGPPSPRRPVDVGAAVALLPRNAPLSLRRPADGPPPLTPRRAAGQAPPPSAAAQTRLPLSPRKRTGDDNGCNLFAAPTGSPPKQPRSSLTPSRRPGSDENAPIPASPDSRPSPRRQETPAGSPALQKADRKPPVARLFAKKSGFQSVKRALHTALPDRLLSRDAERASIRGFLEETLLRRRPGSLYISGAPGSGKTACLSCVLRDMEAELAPVKSVMVNCMSLRSAHAVFPLLADRLGAPGGPGGLQRLLTAPGPAVLLVLDEMDQLDSRSQDVLYTIFEWPHLPQSRLCLIGVANALDLTDRILPRLQARPRCRPLLLNFPPYSRQELADIVQDRLAQASADGVVDASAVQFCARKVSAVSGDARKALDICRRAVEIVESDERKNDAAGPAGSRASRVGLPQVARVLSEVYGDRMASGGGSEGESFPLQQKLLVCCLLLLIRTGRSREVVLGKLHEVYSRLCAQRKVCAAGQAECLSLCSLLESRGIFALKKAKEARLTKVFLRIEEKEVENALKDRTLLGSILAAGLPS